MARILIKRSFLFYFMHRLFLARIARPLLTLFHAPALRAPPILHAPPSSFLCLVLVLAVPFFYTSSILLSALFGSLRVPPLWRARIKIVLDLPAIVSIFANARRSRLPFYCRCPAVLVPSPLCLSSSRSSTLPSYCASLGPPLLRTQALTVPPYETRPYHVVGPSLRRRTGLLRSDPSSAPSSAPLSEPSSASSCAPYSSPLPV